MDKFPWLQLPFGWFVDVISGFLVYERRKKKVGKNVKLSKIIVIWLKEKIKHLYICSEITFNI